MTFVSFQIIIYYYYFIINFRILADADDMILALIISSCLCCLFLIITERNYILRFSKFFWNLQFSYYFYCYRIYVVKLINNLRVMSLKSKTHNWFDRSENLFKIIKLNSRFRHNMVVIFFDKLSIYNSYIKERKYFPIEREGSKSKEALKTSTA